ncbi:MAG: hypothetical protein ACOX1R_10335 [Caldicoprobacterales bacterium]|nr:hypothetical protein [Clostridiales bacterium]
MDRNQKEIKGIDSKDELKLANERRIEELLDINNRYVRTQRHLEEHSDISDPDNLRHALKIQEERENRMENLKNIIAYGKHEEVDERENLKRNLEYTDGYLENNASRMDKETLDNTREKQAHRKEQLEFLD